MAVLQSIRNLFSPAEPVDELIVPAPRTGYHFKPLSIKDIDRLLQLNLRCFKQGENYTRHTFNYLLTQPQSLGFGAETPSGDMAGFRALDEQPRWGRSHYHGRCRARTPPSRRRPRLIKELEDVLRKKNVSTIVLEVRVSNTAAQDLYAHAGYSVVKRMVRYYHNGEDGFLMMKSLA
jgi:ribosomal protein S18 acetylase RimI-like enzyme